MRRDRPVRPLGAVIAVGRDWIERFLAVQGIDRAMAIGAYAYSALIRVARSLSCAIEATRRSSTSRTGASGANDESASGLGA